MGRGSSLKYVQPTEAQKHSIWINSFVFLRRVRDSLLNLGLLKLETIRLQTHRLLSF